MDYRLSTTEMTYERVWRRPFNSTNVMFHFAGHLVRSLALAVSPRLIYFASRSYRRRLWNLVCTMGVPLVWKVNALIAHDISDFLLGKYGSVRPHL